MNAQELQAILAGQRSYFASGATRPIARRICALNALREALHRHEEAVYAALEADLGKSREEAYMCEVGMIYSEIGYMLRNIRTLARDRRVRTPLAQAVSRSYVKPCPKGVVLIMSPWNYPVMLTLDPLVDALAAGNTAVLKPSAYAPRTARVLEEIIADAFPPELAAVITGGRAENTLLLEQKFDHIFFTGSQAVGRLVMEKAAAHLTPVTLELGGKSPCIVDETADLKIAARRIVFGKFLNCGQTCVAPDYVVCHRSVAKQLQQALVSEIFRQYGEHPLDNPKYGKIINRKHFDRLSALLEGQAPAVGGRTDPEALRIEPTLLPGCSWDSPVMEEEIFGPILPILTYEDEDQLIRSLEAREHPLALYLFSTNRNTVRKFTENCAFGGGCVNDTIIHLATSRMGFGGFGASGMGSYHGADGFRTFSHFKSIVEKRNHPDLPMRYQPYTALNAKLVKLFLK